MLKKIVKNDRARFVLFYFEITQGKYLDSTLLTCCWSKISLGRERFGGGSRLEI